MRDDDTLDQSDQVLLEVPAGDLEQADSRRGAQLQRVHPQGAEIQQALSRVYRVL